MSQTITVPLGSQHIALLEPIRFSFECENETIVGVKTDAGFVHRGVEKACEERFKFKQVGYAVARVCGLCAIIHSTCYVGAVESAMGIETSKRVQYLRVLANELDRLHSHLLCLAHTAENAGFEWLFMQTMKDREIIMDAQEILMGNRVQFDFVTVGGVNRDLNAEIANDILKKLDIFEEKLKKLRDLFENNWSLSLRYKGIGVITKEKAFTLGAIGPIGRASGVASDVRAENDFLPYGELDFKMMLQNSGDIHARNIVRLDELQESIRLVRAVINNLPEGELQTKVRGTPKTEAFMRVEAPRGECLYYIKGNGTQFLDRVKIKTPTFSCVPVISDTFIGQNYADAPAILASFDPCLSCTAR